MNRFFLAVLASALMLTTIVCVDSISAQSAADQTNVPPPTLKIGWMNVDQAIMTCDEGEKIYNDISKFRDSKQNERDVMLKELEDLRVRLEVQASKLTEDALMNLDIEARTKETNLQRFVEDTQREIDIRQQRMLRTISEKMGPVIEKVAIDKGLDAVMIFNPQRDAWINPALNVTEDIVKAYNQTYPAGGPIMPAAAKKP